MEGKEMNIKVGIKIDINILESFDETEKKHYLNIKSQKAAEIFGIETFNKFKISITHPTERQIEIASLGKTITQRREHEQVISLHVFSDEAIKRLLEISEELDIRILADEMRYILKG